MTDIIHLLPDSVANQIAAGEVVQRPASAVKELLENAIDAGASSIELIIKDGGRTLIQLIDNGCGMSETDARLCFDRHATSKISKADDLFAIRTMGFRGEALASIAAIAQVELKTRLHDAELGTCIIIEGSVVKSQEVCQCPAGTSLAIKNLFFNVPARRNFLKSDAVEFGHIEEEFRRVTLANPTVGFTLYNNGKLLYKLEKASFLQRIMGLMGDNYKQKLLPIEQETSIINVSGYISKAEYAKKTRGEQYFFVNKRFIKHPYLHHAVENAFSELLPERHIPSYFINLEIDPKSIDINIHPTKTEIKFVDEKSIYAILRSTVKKSLGQFTLMPQIDFDTEGSMNFPPVPKGYIPKAPSIEVDKDYNPFTKRESEQKNFPHSTSQTSFREQSNKENWQKLYETAKEENTQLSAIDTFFVEKQENTSNFKQEPDTTNCSSVIQFKNQYIVTSLKSGLAIIDQQRAHERILYEEFLQKTSQEDNSSQQLLFPVTCSFSAANAEILSEILPDIQQMGFDIEAFGQNTFVVRGVPSNIEEKQINTAIEELIDNYKSSLLQKFSNKEQSLAASLSKQFAVKPGKKLSIEEMQSIIARLFACQAPTISPSGKKIFLVLNEVDLIEKLK